MVGTRKTPSGKDPTTLGNSLHVELLDEEVDHDESEVDDQFPASILLGWSFYSLTV